MAAVVVVAATGSAWAGPFGGFSGDEKHYLLDGDRMCEPVAKRFDALRCTRADASQVSAAGFDRGAVQRGSKAQFAARPAGTCVVVTGVADRATVAAWDTTSAVTRTGEVFLSKSGRLVAVEFETRQGGRVVSSAVVLHLPEAVAAVAAAGAKGHTGAAIGAGGGAVAPVAGSQPPAPDPPEVTAAIARGRVHLGKKRYPQAIAEFRAALAVDAEHPEARYLLARGLASTGKLTEALAELTALGRSRRPSAPRWRVEARHDASFAKLRTDPTYRKAVGIDPDPGRPASAYERLVGHGGRWEQPVIPCEQARANLDLRRDKEQSFDLVIRSKCQGIRETTRLDGHWTAEGTSGLTLTFPNPEMSDEGMRCGLELCSDGSGEDCLRCQVEEDIEFLFRVVRR